MKKMVNLAKVLISFGVLFSIQVHGALITSDTNPGSSVVDFFGFSGGIYSNGATVDVGGSVGEEIILGNPTNSALYTSPTSIFLNENGSWNYEGGTFFFAAVFSGVIRFDFMSGPVSMVGGLLNYERRNDDNLVITALGNNGQVLETHNITEEADILTPGARNQGEFRGIQRGQNDIFSFLISGTSESKVIDNFTFARQGGSVAVPEPHILSIFALALLAIACRRFRRS